MPEISEGVGHLIGVRADPAPARVWWVLSGDQANPHRLLLNLNGFLGRFGPDVILSILF